jgi:DNA-binding response OmpR family regulator
VLFHDLDGDGRDELLAATQNPATLAIWSAPPSGWQLAPRARVLRVPGYPLGPVTVRSDSFPEVIAALAARSTDELVAGLALGADDYLPKPFRFAELVARLRALGRRTGEARPPILSAGDLTLDPARRAATRGGSDLDLTVKEFGVLQALLEAQGAVVTPEALLERVWDENLDPLSNTVRMTVMTLRRKLGDPPLIETVRGSGYRV